MPKESCLDVVITIQHVDLEKVEEVVEKLRRVFLEESAAVQFDTQLIGIGTEKPIVCGPLSREKNE